MYSGTDGSISANLLLSSTLETFTSTDFATPGATYLVKYQEKEQCCGWSIPRYTTFSIGEDQTIPVINGNQEVCEGGDPTSLSQTTSPTGGVGAWTYQWEQSVGCTGTFEAISMETGTTYDPPSGLTETTCFRLAATNNCGTVYSIHKTVVVNSNPTVTVDPGGPICEGNSIELGSSVNNGTAPFTYAWTPSASLDDPTISAPNAIPTETTLYSLNVTDTKGCVGSANGTLSVNEAPVVSIISTTTATCTDATDGSASFSVAGGTAPYTYIWHDDPIWINEIHYDNSGADIAEGVEIAGPAGFNLENYKVYFYNGADGISYTSPVNLTGVIPNQVSGFGTLWFAKSGIQDDFEGVALVGPNDGTLQFLSYEGSSLTAVDGPSIGLISEGIGVSESGGIVGGSLQLTGSGAGYYEYSWASEATATPGSPNTGQSFINATVRTSSLAPGSYDVLAIDANGCYGTNTLTINPPSTAVITSIDYTCSGSQFDLVGQAPAILTEAGSWNILTGSGTIVPGAVPGQAKLKDLIPNSSIVIEYSVSGGVGIYCPDNSVEATLDYLTVLASSADPIVSCTPDPTGGIQYLASTDGEKLYVALNPNGNNLGSTSIELPGANAFTSPESYWGGLGDEPNGAYGGGSVNPARMPSSKPACPDELFVEDIYEIDVTTQPATNDPVVIVYVPKAKWDSFVNNGNTWLNASPGRRTSYEGCYNGFPAVSDAPTTANTVVTVYHNDGRSLHIVNNVATVTDPDGDYYAITFTTDRFSGFVIHGSGSGDPLPLQLVSFTGVHQNGMNQLNWVTASEINVSHFEVERSANGTDFVKIASVEAAGNTTITHDYQFLDRTPPSGGNYYRLRIVDADNTFEYSKVIYLSSGQAVAINQYINVVPNPFTDKFNVQFYQAEAGVYNIQITDLAGRPVVQITRDGAKGLISVPFDLSAEAAGSYLIQVTRQDGMRLMRQVVKSTD